MIYHGEMAEKRESYPQSQHLWECTPESPFQIESVVLDVCVVRVERMILPILASCDVACESILDLQSLPLHLDLHWGEHALPPGSHRAMVCDSKGIRSGRPCCQERHCGQPVASKLGPI